MITKIKNSYLIITIFAFLVAVSGIWLLSTQYHKINNGTNNISIQEILEQNSAKNIITEFMTARIDKNQEQAVVFFTENAMQQYLNLEFILIDDYTNFEIIKTEKTENEKYRFTIKISEKNNINETIESITVIKILDKYYINSIQIIG